MSDVTTVRSGLGRRRWLILGVIGLAQLMVVLDLTVMNIALPSAQRAFRITRCYLNRKAPMSLAGVDGPAWRITGIR